MREALRIYVIAVKRPHKPAEPEVGFVLAGALLKSTGPSPCSLVLPTVGGPIMVSVDRCRMFCHGRYRARSKVEAANRLLQPTPAIQPRSHSGVPPVFEPSPSRRIQFYRAANFNSLLMLKLSDSRSQPQLYQKRMKNSFSDDGNQ